MPIKEDSGLLNERFIAIIIVILLALIWSVNEIHIAGAMLVAGVSITLLFQLEFKRRQIALRNRQDAIRRQNANKREGAMTMRANTLNRLPSPILLINSGHNIAFANELATDLLGDDIVGNDVFLYLRQSSFVAAMDSALSGHSIKSDTLRYTTSNDRTFDVTVAPVPASNDGLTGQQAMVFFYEVTSLLKSEQMRVDFVANASHELRTPLTSVMGFVETLQGPAADDPEAQKRFLTIMHKEGERMVRLIDDLLSLSRIEMSRHLPLTSTMDVAQTLHSVMNSMTVQAQERNITLDCKIADDVNVVLADTDQIIQVLVNLLSNACKYAEPDSTVHMTATLNHNGKFAVISIRDEGPGIPTEHLARLTERFYRVDTARSRKMGGTGLGLAIVKHILLRHNSQLDIRSQVGKGTIFSFRLGVPQN